MGSKNHPDQGEVVIRFPLDDPWLYDMKRLKARAEQFDHEMESALDLFAEFLAGHGIPREQCDLTLESLDLIQPVYAQLLADTRLSPLHLNRFKTRLARYTGTVLQRRRGGHWELCTAQNDFDFGLPVLTGVRGYPSGYAFSPRHEVDRFDPSGILSQRSLRGAIEDLERYATDKEP